MTAARDCRMGPQRLRRIALVGIFAVLVQAVLFGWHHHEVPISAGGPQSVGSLVHHAPLLPAAADDDCDICITLHHVGAAPLAIAALAVPILAVAPALRPRPAVVRRDLSGIFRARAPPRA